MILLARQQAARVLWELQGTAFEPYVSKLVIDEAARGDPTQARLRLIECQHVPQIEITPQAVDLSQRLMDTHAVPLTEPEDALHIALATLAEMDYIVSLNFSHMVGAQAKFALQTQIQNLGFKPPLLVTPDDLLEIL